VHVQEERTDCANCGAVLAGDARFCQRCGAPVSRVADDGEPVEEGGYAARIPPLPTWAPRAGAIVLIALTAASVLFALLVLVFGLFVE
jgi:predicted amidophosphoribosyltransferase